MKVIGIIPTRMNSSRFPGKPMEKILGLPMIGHCYLRSRLSKQLDELYVATCDKEIEEYVCSLGGKVIITSNSHTRASTRTAEALKRIEKNNNLKIEIVVMIQGDEPLIIPETISQAIKAFDDRDVKISNVMSRFHSQESFEDKNNVKVVVNKKNDALYFSRESIPSPWKSWGLGPCYNQTGIIAFRRDTLLYFNSLKETYLEKTESVDMNRILENGEKIRMVPTDAYTIGVDVPDDLFKAKSFLEKDQLVKSYINL